MPGPATGRLSDRKVRGRGRSVVLRRLRWQGPVYRPLSRVRRGRGVSLPSPNRTRANGDSRSRGLCGYDGTRAWTAVGGRFQNRWHETCSIELPMYRQITGCRICGSEWLEVLLELGTQFLTG